MSGVVVIGVGNPWRRDDGVGWAVADAARRRLPPAVAVLESDGEASRLLDAWADHDLAVVVDAVCSGADPGTIHVWDGDADVAHGRRRQAPTPSASRQPSHLVAPSSGSPLVSSSSESRRPRPPPAMGFRRRSPVRSME